MEFASWVLLLGFLVGLLYLLLGRKTKAPVAPEKYHVGDITLEGLRFYSGYDWTKPPLLAIKGKVYDLSNKYELYGPGKPKNVYAGREVARALALDSTAEQDLTDNLEGLTPEQLQRLEETIQEFDKLHDHVGQVVPLREFTLSELAMYDGSDPSQPLYLSIKGAVYDITKGKGYYGPDGIYPFAGKEVARAFALISTDVADCNDNLEGLSYTELDSLRDWIAKFNSKYPIVGKIVAAK